MPSRSGAPPAGWPARAAVQERRVEKQMHVELQELLRQVRMVDESAEDVAGVLGVAALGGKHHGEGAVDGVVPLIRGQRGHSHGLLLSRVRIRFSFPTNRFPPFVPKVNAG